jgi:glycosyltransferase involved in cell wall biosynthesis
VLGQDYQNLEILVVGDCCTDDTAERLTAISDPRLKFINLPERGRYPERPEWRWMVAGTTPVNHALELARGDFITHLDDDDRYAPDRIRHLVTSMQQQPADFIFHPFWHEYVPDKWRLNQAERLSSGYVTTSSIFYHRWLACIPWDINAYKTREPGDFNRIRKLKHLGIVTRRYPQPLLWHYRERSQPPR